MRNDTLQHAKANGLTAEVNTPPAKNMRIELWWVNELTKAFDEVARKAESVVSHCESTLAYARKFETIVGVHNYANDPAAELVDARSHLRDIDRMFDQTFWLLGYEVEAIEALKALAKENVSDRYAPFFA